MKKYLLLRNNHQSGPYSIEQLASIRLVPLDLLWIENESAGWRHPDEIDELKNLIGYDANTRKEIQPNNRSEKIFVSLPSNFSQKRRYENEEHRAFPVNQREPVLETNYVRPLQELKENYKTIKQNQPVWKRKLVTSANVATVPVIFIGVVLGAFIIKKWVDGYVPAGPEETATAIPVIDREVEKQPDENIQNALVTEIVPVYKKAPAKKTAKKVNLKKQLRIAANDYKVGLFGGINGVQLTLFNNSNQLVDKAIIAVDYLRPNGSVVQSENVAFSSIKPKTAQTIPIPGSSRGVKVHYRILKVYSHDYKADLKQI